MADSATVLNNIFKPPPAGRLAGTIQRQTTAGEYLLIDGIGRRFTARSGEQWQAKVLVLRSEDAEKVEAVVAKGREIMLGWHEANYDRLREALSDLTPIRNGVPFERVYTEIWHFLFGFANRTLVEEGLFADPYGQDRRYQGFLPVVWADGLAHAP